MAEHYCDKGRSGAIMAVGRVEAGVVSVLKVRCRAELQE